MGKARPSPSAVRRNGRFNLHRHHLTSISNFELVLVTCPVPATFLGFTAAKLRFLVEHVGTRFKVIAICVGHVERLQASVAV